MGLILCEPGTMLCNISLNPYGTRVTGDETGSEIKFQGVHCADFDKFIYYHMITSVASP